MELRKQANELLLDIGAKMADYQDQLEGTQLSSMYALQATLEHALETTEDHMELNGLTDAIHALQEVIRSHLNIFNRNIFLGSMIESTKKALMSEARAELGDAEAELRANSGVSNPELREIGIMTAKLNELITQPHWRKNEMEAAFKDLKHARHMLKEKLKELEEEMQNSEATARTSNDEMQEEKKPPIS